MGLYETVVKKEDGEQSREGAKGPHVSALWPTRLFCSVIFLSLVSIFILPQTHVLWQFLGN